VWRALYESGEFVKAADALVPAPKLRRTEDLMDAAEVMRLARRPERALPYLERAEETSTRSARTSFAMFTRAHILMSDLGRPAQAAKLYQSVHRDHPRSSFAERALAREVEAWAKAGEADEARKAAERYLERYPDGKHTAVVKLRGGLP